ncbi:MAG: hypothetical protein KA419_14695 [Acidobacteria bacterium]|nr:hypothetical protein [Acidobacteriota bacterium]
MHGYFLTHFFKGFRASAAVLPPVENRLLVYGGRERRAKNGVEVTGLPDLPETLSRLSATSS